MKNEMASSAPQSAEKAALVLLLHPVVVKADIKPGNLVFQTKDTTLVVTMAVLSNLARAGFIVRSASQIVLSPAGKQIAQELSRRPGLEVTHLAALPGQDAEIAVCNVNESPLSALQNGARTGRRPFLLQVEFDAGERLRSDFTRSMLMPRISANWTSPVSGGKRAGDANGVESLTNSALAARRRVDLALSGMGSDLSGVVTDICCYLKGFEQVELERKWPKRSAKFILKAGLAVLALHYWPQPPHSSKMRRWGTSDYRPDINARTPAS